MQNKHLTEQAYRDILWMNGDRRRDTMKMALKMAEMITVGMLVLGIVCGLSAIREVRILGYGAAFLSLYLMFWIDQLKSALRQKAAAMRRRIRRNHI